SVEDIHTQILAGGYATARAAIDATAAKWPEASIAKEVSLNRLGYQLVQEHRVDAALEVFADITHRFPDSASAWDSYSETLEGAGKLAAAAEATAKGLAAIAQMPAGPRRDAVDQALHERAARLPR
ncbi:MAG TPA: hypothetical protein VHN14_17860, partial [Kofleriaceae bacterium]|nr:hypothetical protein [Kofleriaceae bacterium]